MVSILRVQLSSCQRHLKGVNSAGTRSIWIWVAVHSFELHCGFVPVLVVAWFVLVADDWEVVHTPVDVRHVEGQCGALEHFHVAKARPRVLPGNVARLLPDHGRWWLLSSSRKLSLEQQVVKRSSVIVVNHCVTTTALQECCCLSCIHIWLTLILGLHWHWPVSMSQLLL